MQDSLPTDTIHSNEFRYQYWHAWLAIVLKFVTVVDLGKETAAADLTALYFSTGGCDTG